MSQSLLLKPTRVCAATELDRVFSFSLAMRLGTCFSFPGMRPGASSSFQATRRAACFSAPDTCRSATSSAPASQLGASVSALATRLCGSFSTAAVPLVASSSVPATLKGAVMSAGVVSSSAPATIKGAATDAFMKASRSDDMEHRSRSSKLAAPPPPPLPPLLLIPPLPTPVPLPRDGSATFATYHPAQPAAPASPHAVQPAVPVSRHPAQAAPASPHAAQPAVPVSSRAAQPAVLVSRHCQPPAVLELHRPQQSSGPVSSRCAPPAVLESHRPQQSTVSVSRHCQPPAVLESRPAPEQTAQHVWAACGALAAGAAGGVRAHVAGLVALHVADAAASQEIPAAAVVAPASPRHRPCYRCCRRCLPLQVVAPPGVGAAAHIGVDAGAAADSAAGAGKWGNQGAPFPTCLTAAGVAGPSAATSRGAVPSPYSALMRVPCMGTAPCTRAEGHSTSESGALCPLCGEGSCICGTLHDCGKLEPLAIGAPAPHPSARGGRPGSFGGGACGGGALEHPEVEALTRQLPGLTVQLPPTTLAVPPRPLSPSASSTMKPHRTKSSGPNNFALSAPMHSTPSASCQGGCGGRRRWVRSLTEWLCTQYAVVSIAWHPAESCESRCRRKGRAREDLGGTALHAERGSVASTGRALHAEVAWPRQDGLCMQR
eukprot:363577-Chlamydomonas_euryale.AAC.3